MWEIMTTVCGGEVTCVNNTYTWSISNADTNPDGTLFTTFLATLNGGDYYSPVASTSPGQILSNGPTACLANHCDWRIPTVAELYTIVESSAPNCGGGSPCIDPAFGPMPPVVYLWYWSASTLVNYPDDAWIVNFSLGSANTDYKTPAPPPVYARAVRTAR